MWQLLKNYEVSRTWEELAVRRCAVMPVDVSPAPCVRGVALFVLRLPGGSKLQEGSRHSLSSLWTTVLA